MKIVGVGCGPGLLTEQAIREISRAKIIYRIRPGNRTCTVVYPFSLHGENNR